MKRGFAKLSVEERRKVSSAGGRMGHIKGRAHRWTKEEAQAAGKKGGAIRGAQLRKKVESA